MLNGQKEGFRRMILMELYRKEDIYYALEMINRRLASRNLYLSLKIVGGDALIFNGIRSVETEDIDTINRLTEEIKEICLDCSLDINDDAIQYLNDYIDCEFIEDKEHTFSNIEISYLDLGGVIKTKVKNCQDEDKMYKLAFLIEKELKTNLTVDDISNLIIELGETPNTHDIQEFLENLALTDY